MANLLYRIKFDMQYSVKEVTGFKFSLKHRLGMMKTKILDIHLKMKLGATQL